MRLESAVFESSPNAIVVNDSGGRLALANNHSHHAFGLLPRDIGRPFQDLEVSYRPVELRSYMDLARAEKRPKHIREVERTTAGETTYYDITVTPLFGDALEVVGVQIAFVDVTHHHRLQAELHKTNAKLEAGALRGNPPKPARRSRSSRSGAHDSSVEREDGRPLGAARCEVDGKHFMNLDIGLPVTDLAAAIRACLQGDDEEEIEKTLDCTNRRGMPIACNVFVTRLASAEERGVIILVEEQATTSEPRSLQGPARDRSTPRQVRRPRA